MTSSMRVGGPPRAPEQTVVYAIGDVHGRLDLLERLTEQLAVETEAAAREGKATVAVFLGDYIDRGPDSAGVIEHLLRFREQAACDSIFLRGNHEDVLLSLVDGDEDSARWLEYGGVETLRSYGVSFRSANPNPSVEKLRQTTVDAIPPAHIAFLRETELCVTFGDYIFVHAGLRPDRLIEEQTDSDMMWFRYYDDEPPIWSGTVVHGHSVNPRPIRGRSRIGIDTGAYATDALTALRLEGERQDFLKVSLSPEDGALEVEFWDTVDKAFAGGVRAVPQAANRRNAKPRAAAGPSAGSPRPAAGRAPAAPKAKAAGKAKPAARASAFPTIGVAAAATVAFAAAAVVAVILYRPSVDALPGDLSPQTIAAELRTEPPPEVAPAAPVVDAAAEASATDVPPAAPAQPEAATELRPLSPAMERDRASGPPAPPAAPPRTGPAAPALPAARPAATASAQPPPAPRAVSAGGSRVQIAAAPSTEDARRAWTATAQQFPAYMNGKGLQTEQVQVGERTLYRTLVAGFASDEDARRFCDRLRQSGRDCIVRPGG